MTDEKRRAREAARAARHDVPEAVRAAAGDAIADRVLALDGIERVHAVLGYAATPGPFLATSVAAIAIAEGVQAWGRHE